MNIIEVCCYLDVNAGISIRGRGVVYSIENSTLYCSEAGFKKVLLETCKGKIYMFNHDLIERKVFLLDTEYERLKYRCFFKHVSGLTWDDLCEGIEGFNSNKEYLGLPKMKTIQEVEREALANPNPNEGLKKAIEEFLSVGFGVSTAEVKRIIRDE